MMEILKSKLEPVKSIGLSTFNLIDGNDYFIELIDSITYLTNFTPNLERIFYLENSEFSSDLLGLLNSINKPIVTVSNMETAFMLSDAVIYFTLDNMLSAEYNALSYMYKDVLSIVLSLEDPR